MRKITYDELVNSIFDEDVKPNELGTSLPSILGKRFAIEITKGGDASYTSLKTENGKAVANINISVASVCDLLGKKRYDEVGGSEENVMQKARKVKGLLKGLSYHEIDHLMHTDMDRGALNDIVPVPKREFCGKFSNIMEDLSIDHLGMPKNRYHRYTAQYIGMLERTAFDEQAANYQDDGSLNSFLQYVLLYGRSGPKRLASGNARFESLKAKGFMERFRDAYRERNATKRFEKQIALAQWVWDELGVDDREAAEFASQPMPQFSPSLAPAKEDGLTLPMGAMNLPDENGEISPPDSETQDASGMGDGDQSGLGDIGNDQLPGENAKQNRKGGSKNDEKLAAIVQRIVTRGKLYKYDNSVIDTEASPGLRNSWKRSTKSVSTLVCQLAKSLKRAKASIGPRPIYNSDDGDAFDFEAYRMAHANRTPDPNVFVSERKGTQVNDLSVSILVDCSGSMEGLRSMVSLAACTALVMACDQAKIPCECSYFSGSTVTKVLEYGQEVRTYGYRVATVSWKGIRGIGNIGGTTDLGTSMIQTISSLSEWHGTANKCLFVITDGFVNQPNIRIVEEAKAEAKENGIAIIAVGIETAMIKNLFDRSLILKDAELGRLPGFVASELYKAYVQKNYF